MLSEITASNKDPISADLPSYSDEIRRLVDDLLLQKDPKLKPQEAQIPFMQPLSELKIENYVVKNYNNRANHEGQFKDDKKNGKVI